MNPRCWRWLASWIVLVGALVSCGSRPAEPSFTLPTPFQPTVQPTPFLGVEQSGPLPEYRIILTLDPVTRSLAGQQQVTIPNRSGVDLDEIVFRLYPNLPQYGGLISIGPTWAEGERVTSFLRADATSLVIPLPRSLAPDEAGLKATIAEVHAWDLYALCPDQYDPVLALQLARQGVDDGPDDPDRLYTLASVLYREGRFTEAREACRRSVELDTPRTRVWGGRLLLLAMIEQRLGRPAEARRIYKQAEERIRQLREERQPDMLLARREAAELIGMQQ